MSQSQHEVIRAAFEALQKDDLDALIELYAEDVELRPLTGTRVESGGYRGHDGPRRGSPTPWP